MHMLTLRVFSHGLNEQVLELTTIVDHLEKLEKVEQRFTVFINEERDEVTLQLEFDPPIDLATPPAPSEPES